MGIQVAFFATVAVVSGLVLFRKGFRDLRRQRLVRDTPTARIRSMPMGLVELCGQVSPRSELAAPFSGRPCAYWQVDVARRGKNNTWSVVHRAASGNPFYLRDETGVALVYPQDAEAKLAFQLEEVCSGLALPDCYAAYLAGQPGFGKALWRVGTLRFRERALEPGQRVYVLGTAMPRAQSVSVSMDDELAATGTEDRRAFRLRTLDHEVQAVVRRGENERTYIISQQSERDMTLQLGLRAVAELVGGPALALIGLAFWISVLGSLPWFR
jgi:hypothetical protein